ncbi:hypothetical protein BDW62DRAFT_67988 [Aspergillus aurantiobrunneus]
MRILLRSHSFGAKCLSTLSSMSRLSPHCRIGGSESVPALHSTQVPPPTTRLPPISHGTPTSPPCLFCYTDAEIFFQFCLARHVPWSLPTVLFTLHL